MPVPPRIAIVGMGGMFPVAADPGRLWENVLPAPITSRDVPPGRWLLSTRRRSTIRRSPPRNASIRAAAASSTISRSIPRPRLAGRLLADLDPVFHLALHAGRQAFAPA